MTTTPKPAKKGSGILGAFTDFLILCLLISGAGFGGYFIGINQRLAPVQLVAPGTPGAIPLTALTQPQSVTATTNPGTGPGTNPGTQPATASTPAAVEAASPRKTKFWLTSSGTAYVGYGITANVNGTPVDSFYFPGKIVDIGSHVKKGNNTLTFDCKPNDDYNQHKGDAKSVLTVQLVTGPSIREDFPQSAILTTCKRNAAEAENFAESFEFTSKE